MDAIDVKIINLLLEDGRMPAAEIARRVGEGVSERVVRYRIQRLIDQGIIKVTAIVRPQAFGYTTFADVWLEVESDHIMEVARTLATYPNVTYVASAIGETDVSIQIVARSTDEIYRFVTEVVRRIPGVRKSTTSIVPLVLKDVYEWRVPAETLTTLADSRAPSAQKPASRHHPLPIRGRK
ncbi:MAG: Lrp/AsnC family transcriptional regulator [Anaerolineales bacterium]